MRINMIRLWWEHNNYNECIEYDEKKYDESNIWWEYDENKILWE